MGSNVIFGKSICYVSDNRDRGYNWGCRATSIALRMLLERCATIDSVIYGETVQRPISSGPWNWLMKFGPVRSAFSHYGSSRPLARMIVRGAGLLQTEKWYADLNDPNPNVFLRRMKRVRHWNRVVDKVLSSIERAECIVINGEGDMIFTTPQRRTLSFLLMVMTYALELGKDVFYVNGIVSDCPRTGRNPYTVDFAVGILKQCAEVSLRDVESLRLARSLGIANAVHNPDALFSWFLRPEFQNTPNEFTLLNVPAPEYPERFSAFNHLKSRYFCFCGSGVAGNECARSEVVSSYYEVAIALRNVLIKRGIGLVLVSASGSDSYMEDVARAAELPLIPKETNIFVAAKLLAGAEGFVTGRYHPAIMASLGTRKCVFLGSNSHKTRSLQKLLGYEEVKEYPVIPKGDDIDRICNDVENIIDSQLRISKDRIHELALSASDLFVRRLGV